MHLATIAAKRARSRPLWGSAGVASVREVFRGRRHVLCDDSHRRRHVAPSMASLIAERRCRDIIGSALSGLDVHDRKPGDCVEVAPRLDEHGIPGQLVLTAAHDLLAHDTSVRAGLTRRRLVRLTELTVEVTDAQTTDTYDRAPAPMDLGLLMAGVAQAIHRHSCGMNL